MNNIDIKEFRKKFNLSQEALARVLNVATATIRAWETKRNNMPKKYSELLRIYDTNGLPVSDLNNLNNNSSNQIKDYQNQINDLIELLKEKDKQINNLNNNSSNQIKDYQNQINDLIELLKEKDKQINDLTAKLLEFASMIK